MSPKEPIPDLFGGLPVLSAKAMRELDRRACQTQGLSVLGLMENAGRGAAAEAGRFLKEKLGKDLGQAAIGVCCGRGANGGDGLVCARYLRQGGAKVSVFICPPKKEGPTVMAPYPGPVEENLKRAREAGVEVSSYDPALDMAVLLAGCDMLVDALLGTGSTGKPAGAVRDMIQAMTRSKKPVLALDIPSGLDPDTGYHSGAFVSAAATLTLGVPKRGLLAVHAKKYVGELRVLDIGYPAELVREFLPKTQP